MSVTVVRNERRHRYEALVDGEVAGYAQFREPGPGRTVFTQTLVEEAHEGRGIGRALAHGALEDARSRGDRIVAQCPFLADYLQRHPEYRDLVDEPDWDY